MDQQAEPKLSKKRLVLLIVLGLVGALVCLEFLLRILDTRTYAKFSYDQESGLLTHEPNIAFTEAAECYENRIRINNMGFHGHDVTSEKGKDVFRILVVGSSFVEGMQVPWEEGFVALLEDRLNAMPDASHAYEVIPIAFSGNGTYLDMMYYERYGTRLNPDLVIALTTEYEVGRNALTAKYPPRFDEQGNAILELPRMSQNPLVSSMKNVIRKSKAFMTLVSRVQVVQARAQAFVAHPALFRTEPEVAETSTKADVPREEIVRRWEIEERLIKAFADQVKGDGVPFLLASWATPYASSSTKSELRERLAAISSRVSFPYLNLEPAIEAGERAEGKSPTWTCDGHWNEDGHRWATDGFFEYLNQHPELLQRTAP